MADELRRVDDRLSFDQSSDRRKLTEAEKLYVASQWQLMWRKLRRHTLAIIGASVLAVGYLVAIFSPFISPYSTSDRTDYLFMGPQKVRLFHEGKLHRPFVYGVGTELDPETWKYVFTDDKARIYPVNFFVQGSEYKLLGLIPSSIHLFGVPGDGVIFLLGTEELGRDVFSRDIQAASISMSIGLAGVAFSFILGCIFGGLSGFYGGLVDIVVQRVIEFLTSIPSVPLWMALSAAVPPHWDSVKVYFGITLILSLQGWCGLARVVRGKLLELREEDFVVAAQVAGTSDGNIIAKHLLPAFMSYLIVNVTLGIPGMILGETALSFLGLGLRPPIVSWGVLLQQAQNVRTVSLYPWLLSPAFMVIAVVLAFNFLGDGLRDAADPYAV
jgi:peptide/nickel transport system permease protein